MTQRTPLYEQHLQAGGRMVEFAGWELPIHYGSQIEEHHRVRRAAGMFDVSHMTIIDLKGERVVDFLRHLLANDVARISGQPGKALYSCMLNEEGGVIDDLIVYHLRTDWFRLVVNAATRDKDLAWIERQASDYGVEIHERPQLAMIAVQGPRARDKALVAMPAEVAQAAAGLKRFFGAAADGWFVGRTGYTGEDGFEIMLPTAEAGRFWDALLAEGVQPAGLGARDTLRLEAGMSLYGTDMDERISPLQCGLGWTVAWQPAERDFIGRAALEEQKAAGIDVKMVGLVLEGRGVLRSHQKVIANGAGEGEVTSGSFSPTLEQSIALARVPSATGDRVEVEIRKKRVPARVVMYPFVREGQSCLS